MIKVLTLIKRKANLSVADFQNHWQYDHANLVTKQKHIRCYVQNHVLESAFRNREPIYDGVSESWFDDLEAFEQSTTTPEYGDVAQDCDRFMEMALSARLITREVVIVDNPAFPKAAKMLAFLSRRKDVNVEQFQTHWRHSHGPIAGKIPGNKRYVQCHVTTASYAVDHSPAFDGVAMSWFADMDALRASGDSIEYEKTRADEVHFLSGDRIPFIITREIEIL